jgi:putative lipoic acid-binding regulatory protein
MSDDKEPRPIYPCVFPVKIVGECCDEFETGVLAVMKNYVDDLSSEKIGRKMSQGGKYLSLTINIIAKDREYVEKLYKELNALDKVIMVI